MVKKHANVAAADSMGLRPDRRGEGGPCSSNKNNQKNVEETASNNHPQPPVPPTLARRAVKPCERARASRVLAVDA